MHVLKHQLYLLEQHHLIFGQQLYWIYTEDKSLTMKLGPGKTIFTNLM